MLHFSLFFLWFDAKILKKIVMKQYVYYLCPKKTNKCQKYCQKKVGSFWKVLVVPRKNSTFSGLCMPCVRACVHGSLKKSGNYLLSYETKFQIS